MILFNSAYSFPLISYSHMLNSNSRRNSLGNIAIKLATSLTVEELKNEYWLVIMNTVSISGARLRFIAASLNSYSKFRQPLTPHNRQRLFPRVVHYQTIKLSTETLVKCFTDSASISGVLRGKAGCFTAVLKYCHIHAQTTRTPAR